MLPGLKVLIATPEYFLEAIEGEQDTPPSMRVVGVPRGPLDRLSYEHDTPVSDSGTARHSRQHRKMPDATQWELGDGHTMLAVVAL